MGMRLTSALTLLAAVALLTGPAAALASTTDPTTGTPLSTDAENEAAAHARADALVRDLLVPAGARQVDSPPVSALDRPATVPGIANGVHATGYWVLPEADASSTATWFVKHAETGLREDGTGQSENLTTHTVTSYEVMYLGTRGTAAYAAPELDVSVAPDGSDVAVRADAWLDWRYARTRQGFVAGTVHSVVLRTRPERRVGGPRPRVHVARVTSPARIRRLVTAANGLVGEAPLGPHSCPAGIPPFGFDEAIFHSSAGTWAYDASLYCVGSVAVTRDGHAVKPPLDPDGFASALAAVLRARTRG